MHADTAHTPTRKPTVQAAISNKTKTLLFGDGRKRAARRHRDLIAAFGAEVGGFDILVPSDQIVIRGLARLSVELEILESKRANGETIDGLTYLSLTNAQRRALGDFAKLKHRLTAPRVLATKTTHKPASRKRTTALDALRQFGA